jgi:serine protease Do
VTAVQVESPAGKAGMRAGDLILQVNGRAPRSFIDLTSVLRSAKDERDLNFSIQRGSERRAVTVRQIPEKSFFNAELIRKKIGASVQELTPQSARSWGLAGAEGLLITTVDRGSAAAAANLQRGILITSIDGLAADDVTQAAKRLYTKARGDKVQLGLLQSVQRGVFARLHQAAVELTVR